MSGSLSRGLLGMGRKTGAAPALARNYLKSANIPLAKYGGRHTVTMLPGDGIGPEMMGYVKEIFRYTGHKSALTRGLPCDWCMIIINGP